MQAFETVTSPFIRTTKASYIGALKSGRSRSSAQNFILRHIVSNFRNHNIWLSVVWVRSEDNLADGISRGLFPSTPRFDHPPPLPPYLKSLVSLV